MSRSTRLGGAALAVAALVLLTAAPAAASTSRTAVATPRTMTAHPWATDGCSAAPDRGAGFDFHHACVHHDGCYRGHWNSRRTCDDRFRRDLRAGCAERHPSAWGRWPCYALAEVYTAAVRLFGGPAYAHHDIDTPTR
jgi:hypothetical protein